MKLTIDNQLVGLADLRAAWREPLTVGIGKDARRRIAESNELIMDVVAGGEPLKERIRFILDAFADRPHVFNLGHGIGQFTPIEHVEQLVEAVRG